MPYPTAYVEIDNDAIYFPKLSYYVPTILFLRLGRATTKASVIFNASCPYFNGLSLNNVLPTTYRRCIGKHWSYKRIKGRGISLLITVPARIVS